MKKILVIVEQRAQSQETLNTLVNAFIDQKKQEGYRLDVIGDASGILRALLEEQELPTRTITSAQADVMFALNRYKNVIYVPAHAVQNRDILVYDPEQLDKNMIFYHLGHLSIQPRDGAITDSSAQQGGVEAETNRIVEATEVEQANADSLHLRAESEDASVPTPSLLAQAPESYRLPPSDPGEAQEGRADAETAEPPVSHSQKMPFSRRAWMVIPWISMGLMRMLGYQRPAFFALLIALFAALLAALRKSQRGKSKLPEILSVMLASAATMMELARPIYALRVTPALALIGMVLFHIIGNMKLED